MKTMAAAAVAIAVLALIDSAFFRSKHSAAAHAVAMGVASSFAR